MTTNPPPYVPVVAVDDLTRRPARALLRQRCGLLKNQWYVAAQAHQVTTKKPLSAQILEERIVLWRRQDGTVAALRDRCLHRNSPLSAGDVVGDCVGCPYHGWTYDGEGRVVNIPAEGPDGAAPKGLAVERFPVIERHGLVWVWMGGADAPTHEPFAMPYYDDPAWGQYYMETDFDNGVTALVENFMDVPHTVWVHRGWFRNRSRKPVDMTIERTADSVLVTYGQPQDEIGFTRWILNPKGLPMTHTDKFYMPNVTRVDYLYGDPEDPATGFAITSQCTPVDAQRSRVYTLISYKLGPWNPVLGLMDRFLRFYTRQVIQQDVDIMAIHGHAQAHYEGRAYTSTPVDLLHVFIESLRDWAEDGGPDPRPAPAVEHTRFWI